MSAPLALGLLPRLTGGRHGGHHHPLEGGYPLRRLPYLKMI
jgi:hypothetical protein